MKGGWKKVMVFHSDELIWSRVNNGKNTKAERSHFTRIKSNDLLGEKKNLCGIEIELFCCLLTNYNFSTWSEITKQYYFPLHINFSVWGASSAVDGLNITVTLLSVVFSFWLNTKLDWFNMYSFSILLLWWDGATTHLRDTRWGGRSGNNKGNN